MLMCSALTRIFRFVLTGLEYFDNNSCQETYGIKIALTYAFCLYLSGKLDLALKAAIHLQEFEDIIDPVDIYSLLGNHGLLNCFAIILLR